jgi:hypothetical protein
MEHMCQKYVAWFEHLMDASEDRFQAGSNARGKLINEQGTTCPKRLISISEDRRTVLFLHDAEGDTGNHVVGRTELKLTQIRNDLSR